MAAFVKFNCFVADLGLAKHNFTGSPSLKVALVAGSAPAATLATYSDLSGVEVADGNGYSVGGATCGFTSWSQSSGTAKLVLADPATWQAAGGTIGPFQYAVLYNDGSATKPLIGYWAYTGSLTLAIGETFAVDLDQTNGTLTVA